RPTARRRAGGTRAAPPRRAPPARLRGRGGGARAEASAARAGSLGSAWREAAPRDRSTPARPAGIAPGRRRSVPIPTSAPHSSPVLTALPEGRRSSIRRLRRLYKGELAPPSTPQEITVNSTERWHRARDARRNHRLPPSGVL